MNLLTDAELIELTGATRHSTQIKVLKQHGIPYVVRIDGKPRVTWEMVNKMGGVPQSAPPTIDLSWMNHGPKTP